MATLATPANMRLAATLHPDRTVVAMSINNPHEQWSATPGDYWNVPDDYPLYDADGEPCVLVYKRTEYIDALIGRPV